MEGLETATATEVAELTGRSVSSLYRHLDELADAGFLTKGKAERGGRRQTVYARGPVLSIPPVDTQTGAGSEHAAEFLRLMFHEFGAQVGRYFSLVQAVPGPFGAGAPGARPRFYSELSWLQADEERRINEHIAAIRAIAAEARARRSGTRTQLVLCSFRDVSMQELRDGLSGLAAGQPPGE